MLIFLGFFLMGLPLLVGAYKLLRQNMSGDMAQAGRIFTGFYVFLGLFMMLIALSQVVPFDPINIQRINFLGTFGVLYLGLGFIDLFTFSLLGRRKLAYFIFAAHLIFAIVACLIFLPEATGSKLLLGDSFWFYYWDPGFSPAAGFFNLLLILLSASTYSWYLFNTGLATLSPLIKKRSFTFALGSATASLAGFGYFLSPLSMEDIRPYFVAGICIPGIIGFTMMTIPFFLKEPKKNNLRGPAAV
jgi:hypothetical protein